MDERVPESTAIRIKEGTKGPESSKPHPPNQLVRMRSAVQIRPAAPQILENFGFRGFFVANSCFAVWVKKSDPHRDPHAETAGKDKRPPDGKICLPVRFFAAFFLLYDLPQDAAHGLGGLVLLLPRGVGVGAQGKPGVVVPQHGGHGFHIHPVLEGCGGEGMPEIMEPDVLQPSVLQDLLM